MSTTKADGPSDGTTELEATDSDNHQRRRPAAMSRYLFLGRDADGHAHVANQHAKIVHRISPTGERARTTDLTAHPDPECRCISWYLKFVADTVAWDARRVEPSPFSGVQL